MITLPDELLKRLGGLNTINTNVVSSREASIDSEGIKLLSAIGREQAESSHGDLIRFDSVEYAEKLV